MGCKCRNCEIRENLRRDREATRSIAHTYPMTSSTLVLAGKLESNGTITSVQTDILKNS